MCRMLNMRIKKHTDCPCRQFHNSSTDYTCNITGDDCSEYPDNFPEKCPLPKENSGSKKTPTNKQSVQCTCKRISCGNYGAKNKCNKVIYGCKDYYDGPVH